MSPTFSCENKEDIGTGKLTGVVIFRKTASQNAGVSQQVSPYWALPSSP
jgi:hypothetical protein